MTRVTETPIRIALAGGAAEAEAYREAAARLRGARFTLVVEEDRERARELADAVGTSLACDGLEAALRDHAREFDAVVVRLPLRERAAVARRAAEAGKHLLVEAPLAPDLPGAEAAIDACLRPGLSVGFSGTLRFCPRTRAIRDRLSQGVLGEPGLLRVHRWRSGRDAPRPLLERIWADLDLARWLFGASPSEVYSLAMPSEAVAPRPEYAQVHLGFCGGGMAIIDHCASLPGGREYDSVTLIGSRGAAYADDHRNTHLLFQGGDPSALISEPGRLHVVGELQAFVDAVARRKPLPVTAEDARAAHRIAAAALRSLESGKPVPIEGGGDERARRR